MISLFTSLIPSLFKIGDKMIVDKDKKMEFAFKVQEMTFKFMEVMLNVKTIAWVDALVKLSYAMENIIKGLFRPIGAALMTGFAIYAEVKGIELSATVEAILVGAFPAWGVDRHLDKKKPKKEPIEDDWD